MNHPIRADEFGRIIVVEDALSVEFGNGDAWIQDGLNRPHVGEPRINRLVLCA